MNLIMMKEICRVTSRVYIKIVASFMLIVLLLVQSSYSFDILPNCIYRLRSEVKLCNDIPFDGVSVSLINSRDKNSYDSCLLKFLDKRDLFSKSTKIEFVWARKNIANLKISLCSDKFNPSLEESLIGMCKCHLAKNLHHFLEKILENKDWQCYNDKKEVLRLRHWDDDYYNIMEGIELTLGIYGRRLNLSQEEKDTLNRLLLLFPLNASFNDCVKVLRGSFNLQNCSIQKMSLPQALFIIHINTSQPWFTYFYSDAYNRDKNFYMNCVVSAIKSISEDILDMHFEYDGSLDNKLTMRQQTVLSFIEHFNVPAAQDGTKEKED